MEKMTAIITAIIIGAAIILGIGSRFLTHKTDNIIEEKCEQVIKEKTDIEIDLSPDTADPEDEKK